MSSIEPPAAVFGHRDDPREMTEFGDAHDGQRDGVWYLHRQSTDDGFAATVRCGLFRVMPVPSELTFPYHEVLLTLEGEGTTSVDGGPTIEVRPGRLARFAKHVRASFAPRTTNLEFITVVETDAAFTTSGARTTAADGDAAEGASLGRITGEPSVEAEIVVLAAGQHEWDGDDDRTLYVLDGQARFADATGAIHALRAGSMGFVPRGGQARWTVERPLRLLVTAVR